ncbi:LamG domain-containing protein [Dactylosporangium sp. NPDC006015]|uniref:LamG domain-containing protein n=1 Tax=Dactylosporangium sp. NPDC006015 TaxID=3154576 RepID=UPI0033B998F6
MSTWPFDGTAGGATLVGAPQWTAGHAGQALLLNGSGQYADTGRAVLPTTGNYTVAAWVRLDAAGAFRTVVSQDGATSSAFFLQYSGADKTFAMSFADRRALAPLTPVTGRWYHLAGVRDANAGHLSLYVDGVLARQIDACTADAATGPLVIGRARWGGAPVDYWAGAVDDVRAYDRALTAAQVKAWFQELSDELIRRRRRSGWCRCRRRRPRRCLRSGGSRRCTGGRRRRRR